MVEGSLGGHTRAYTMRKSQDDTAEYVVDINNTEEKDITLPRIGTQAVGVRNKLIHKTH